MLDGGLLLRHISGDFELHYTTSYFSPNPYFLGALELILTQLQFLLYPKADFTAETVLVYYSKTSLFAAGLDQTLVPNF